MLENVNRGTRRIALLAVLTATLTAGKLAIAPVFGVEIVTALLIVYTFIFGWKNTLFVSAFFIVIEVFIFGFHPVWVILYIVYWPALIIVVGLINDKALLQDRDKPLSCKTCDADIKPKKRQNIKLILAIIVGVIFTAFFGVLSTFLETLILGGLEGGMFWTFFRYRYLAGVFFFVVHIASNAIILPVLVPVLVKALKNLNKRQVS